MSIHRLGPLGDNRNRLQAFRIPADLAFCAVGVEQIPKAQLFSGTVPKHDPIDTAVAAVTRTSDLYGIMVS